MINNIQLSTTHPESQALILNSHTKKIEQTISFGKTRKYSFISSVGGDIKKLAQNLISQNLEKLGKLNHKNEWTPSPKNKYIPGDSREPHNNALF